MKYRLLKDLPGLEKGSILSEYGSGSVLRILVAEEGKTVANFFSNEMFEKFFEEIKEPKDSIHWKPKIGDRCFILENANIRPTNYTGMLRDYNAWCTGRVFRTEEECEKALDRELAKVRLQRTSNFKPDFENGKGGWIVFYSYMYKELHSMRDSYTDSGEPVRYETEEDARRSIEENEQDWKIYFGIKEEE